MSRNAILLASVCGALAFPASANDAAGIDVLMELCTPIAATGESLRAGLNDAGWTMLEKADAGQAIASLVASQMWFMESTASIDQQLALTKEYVDAFYASYGSDFIGPIFTMGEQVAMVLASDGNISCIWAGPEDPALMARIDAVGGFPDAEGTVTAARTQLVEVGGLDHRRVETYAFIEASDRGGPLPYAARLDRSPVQQVDTP